MALPIHARIVVVVGGIVGWSTAYRLAALGQADDASLETDTGLANARSEGNVGVGAR